MHTYTWTHPETDFNLSIHHNGDMSGLAIIEIPVELVNIQKTDNGDTVRIKLPAKFLATFSRNDTIKEAIGSLEDLLE